MKIWTSRSFFVWCSLIVSIALSSCNCHALENINGDDTIHGKQSENNHRSEEDDFGEFHVSPKCAATLLVSGTAVGVVGATVLTPAAFCTAGFCPTGIAAGSFASWWQSTMPLVVKNSLFAQLQSIAMSAGTAQTLTLTGAALGSTVAATYIQQFCTFVDETKPETTMGQTFQVSLQAVQTGTALTQASWEAWQAGTRVASEQCASSSHCTAVQQAAVEAGHSISSTWNRFTTSASQLANRAYINIEILVLKASIEMRKKEFGVEIFDYSRTEAERMTAQTGLFDDKQVNQIYEDTVQKVYALESQIQEKLSSDSASSTWSLEQEIEAIKKEFGVTLFDYIYRNNAEGTTHNDLAWTMPKMAKLYRDTLEQVTTLDMQRHKKEKELAGYT